MNDLTKNLLLWVVVAVVLMVVFQSFSPRGGALPSLLRRLLPCPFSRMLNWSPVIRSWA